LQQSLQTTEEKLREDLSVLIHEFSVMTSNNELDSFRQRAQSMLSDSATGCSYKGFTKFMLGLAKKQETIQFWYQYLTSDCFAYIALFVGIRYRSWELRMGSLKQQAAIFSAFDRNTYQRLIPQHLHDVLCLPAPVLAHLQKGSFSVRFNPTEWHGVALDECHEMKINKDAKLAVVRPSKERMAFLSNYLSFRAASVHNLTNQIFPNQSEASQSFTHRPTQQG